MTLILEQSSLTLDWLDVVLDPIRSAVASADDPAGCADGVADVLAGRLPTVDVLTEQQREGSPDHYQQHVLHVEPDARFSIIALVWRPGQATPIHDHVCWCTVGVLAGAEHEVLYGLRYSRGTRRLVELEQRENRLGEITGFAPPGDIHLVRNSGTEVAISLHVYGADIGERGTSVRRVYQLPSGRDR